MKRSEPLRRYARLRTGAPMRRSWMKRKPARRIARETPEESNHKKLVREMRVCAAAKYVGAGRCRGPLQVSHLGSSGGMGAKHGDWTYSTLMCRSHHGQIDGREKPSIFDAMPADELAAWKEREIYLAREFVAGRQAVAT